MGVSIITKGYNAEPNFPPDGPFLPFDVPVRTGLVGYHLFGVSSTKSLFNFAPNGSQGCGIVGAPTYASGYISLLSRANLTPAYITTPYSETPNLFIAAVCRFPGTNDATATRGVLISNVSTLAQDNTTTFNNAIHITPTSAAQFTGTAMRGNDIATATNSAVTISSVLGNWKLITMSIPVTGATIMKDWTGGITATGVSTLTHQTGINLMRFGSSYNTGNGGQVDISSIGIWSAIPDTAGIDSIVSAMRTNAASKSIVV